MILKMLMFSAVYNLYINNMMYIYLCNRQKRLLDAATIIDKPPTAPTTFNYRKPSNLKNEI